MTLRVRVLTTHALMNSQGGSVGIIGTGQLYWTVRYSSVPPMVPVVTDYESLVSVDMF